MDFCYLREESESGNPLTRYSHNKLVKSPTINLIIPLAAIERALLQNIFALIVVWILIFVYYNHLNDNEYPYIWPIHAW